MQLTAEGQLVLPHIRTVLYDQYRLEECVNEINGLRTGLIRIGTFNSVSAQWLPSCSTPGSGLRKTGTTTKDVANNAENAVVNAVWEELGMPN